MAVTHRFFCVSGHTYLGQSCTRHVPLTLSSHRPCGRREAHPLCAVCTRGARRTCSGATGSLDLRQALERPPMPAPAGAGHPVQVDARTGQELRRATRWSPVRHVRVPAAHVDQLVQLPGLIRQRPRAERLLARRSRTCCQVSISLPLVRPRGGLRGRGGGVVGPHGHPLPAPLGRFALSTGRREAWASHSKRTPSRPRCDDVGRYAVSLPGLPPAPACRRRWPPAGDVHGLGPVAARRQDAPRRAHKAISGKDLTINSNR